MRKTGFIIFLVSHLYSYSQETTINGYVKDADNGDAIPYAICYDSISSKGTTTNLEGFFNFKISPHQKLALKISHIGYFSNNIEIVSSKDTTVTIQLHPRLEELAEVKITEFASFQKQEVLGKITVPKSTIQAIPSFIGIPDLMKAITFIPGLSGGREGYSNIYVRGGDRGQNLILLDGIKLYKIGRAHV